MTLVVRLRNILNKKKKRKMRQKPDLFFSELLVRVGEYPISFMIKRNDNLTDTICFQKTTKKVILLGLYIMMINKKNKRKRKQSLFSITKKQKQIGCFWRLSI